MNKTIIVDGHTYTDRGDGLYIPDTDYVIEDKIKWAFDDDHIEFILVCTKESDGYHPKVLSTGKPDHKSYEKAKLNNEFDGMSIIHADNTPINFVGGFYFE